LKELLLNVKHEVDVVLELFSDPDFALPRIIPGYGSHTGRSPFQVVGVLGMYPYMMEGRIFKGSVIKYIFTFIDGLKGSGFIEISRAGSSLKFLADYDGDAKTLFESSFEKVIKKLSKTIDEDVRLERIKRKI
jgi:hypothetical protein